MASEPHNYSVDSLQLNCIIQHMRCPYTMLCIICTFISIQVYVLSAYSYSAIAYMTHQGPHKRDDSNWCKMANEEIVKQVVHRQIIKMGLTSCSYFISLMFDPAQYCCTLKHEPVTIREHNTEMKLFRCKSNKWSYVQLRSFECTKFCECVVCALRTLTKCDRMT